MKNEENLEVAKKIIKAYWHEVASEAAYGYSKMDYTEVGGAPLLGVNGGVIKAHGSSNAKAFFNAIRQAQKLVKGGVTDKIAAAVQASRPFSTEEKIG